MGVVGARGRDCCGKGYARSGGWEEGGTCWSGGGRDRGVTYVEQSPLESMVCAGRLVGGIILYPYNGVH